jgi:hypothetical protein
MNIDFTQVVKGARSVSLAANEVYALPIEVSALYVATLAGDASVDLPDVGLLPNGFRCEVESPQASTVTVRDSSANTIAVLGGPGVAGAMLLTGVQLTVFGGAWVITKRNQTLVPTP